MPDFLVEYVVTQVRFVRVSSSDEESARAEVARYHEQMESEKEHESVIVLKVEKD